MTTFKYTAAAGILVALAALPACSGPAESGAVQGGTEGAAALSAIGAIDRVAERNASRVPASGAAPSFIVDPGWPKPLPIFWLTRPRSCWPCSRARPRPAANARPF